MPRRLAIDAPPPLAVSRFTRPPGRVGRAAIDAAPEEAGAAGLGARPVAGLSGCRAGGCSAPSSRALLEWPDLLILGEPTQGLDQPGVAAFYRAR